MKELNKKGIIDVVSDYNSKTLLREVETPYPLYNGYFEEASKLIGTDQTAIANQVSFAVGAKEVYASHNEFRLMTSLMAYCDYIALITKDKVNKISLYESLNSIIDNAMEALDDYTLFANGLLNDKTLYNFAFSFASYVFNDTVEFLYNYNIPLTEKMYHDLSIANVIYTESLIIDLTFILKEFNDYGYIYNDFTPEEFK